MPGYGYGDTRDRDRKRRRNRSGSTISSSDPKKAEKKQKEKDKDRDDKKAKRRKKEKNDRKEDKDKPSSVKAAAAAAEAAAPGAPPSATKAAEEATSKRGSWREDKSRQPEEDEDDDPPAEGFTQEDDDEEAALKKIAESRARREALIAKWVNRGEQEGGGLEMPNTSTSLDDKGEDADESDGEVAKFFEEKAKQLNASAGDDEEAKKIEEQKALNRFILAQRAEHDGDMFGDEDDDGQALNKKTVSAVNIAQTGASAHDWNDAEGYYRAQVGEVMGDRYKVVEDKCGQGVFSNVVKATDTKTGQMVAIKIMRTNDMMRKAAEKEIELLKLLNSTDKGNKKNVIRLLKEFDYRDHLCLVFECMWDNLRAALKKYTKDKGMSLRAVRAYSKQLLVALHHVHRCDIIHADIKPDNILISAGHNLVKICDLGSAMYTREMEQTPYLVSRFYRAPEICIGAKYGPASDTFAMGASLFEIFTGKILFRGKSNNDMIRCFMEVKGKLPHKMIKTGMCWKQHFNENLDFKFVDEDKMTRKKKVRTVTDCSAKKSLVDMVLQRVGPDKAKSENKDDQLYIKKAKQFADLIGQMTTLDPERRPSAEELLKHPFVTEAWPAATPAAAPNGAEKAEGK